MLDEYWKKNVDLENVPIYYMGVLMAKCMMIFQTYINMAGKVVREAFKRGNDPFNFSHIKRIKKIDEINHKQPNVVMASPGMLQRGLSRDLFDLWCHDEKNGVIFTGYCVETSFAREILSGKSETRVNGEEIPIKMSVLNISFSAHADCNDTKDFIRQVDPKYVVLVHGEKHEAKKLLKDLEKNFPNIQIFAPKNWQVVEIACKSKKICVL